jgi:hypothetical protein
MAATPAGYNAKAQEIRPVARRGIGKESLRDETLQSGQEKCREPKMQFVLTPKNRRFWTRNLSAACGGFILANRGQFSCRSVLERRIINSPRSRYQAIPIRAGPFGTFIDGENLRRFPVP